MNKAAANLQMQYIYVNWIRVWYEWMRKIILKKKKIRRRRRRETCSDNGGDGSDKAINFRSFWTKPRISSVILIQKWNSGSPSLWETQNPSWTIYWMSIFHHSSTFPILSVLLWKEKKKKRKKLQLRRSEFRSEISMVATSTAYQRILLQQLKHPP